MNQGTVLIIGGGTGGHISPGIALYEAFKEKNVPVRFLSGRRDLRFSSLDDIGKSDLLLYRAPSLTKNPVKLPLFVIGFLLAVWKAARIIRKNNITAVVGMGGYVSAPALVAAVIKKAPLFLCEQNTVPGRVTKLFEKRAERILGTFEETRQYLKYGEIFLHVGNPIRKRVMVSASGDEARKAFNLGHTKTVVLAIGGSQGAVSLNELIYGLKKQYPDEFKNIGFIWSTGSYSFPRYRELMEKEMDGGSVYLSPFIDRVGLAYRACTLAISRSGAGVMMELAAMGIPSVQIPYPHAAMNHQDANADVFAGAGAAIKMSNEDAVPEKVAPVILEILNNPRTIQNMAEKARSLARVNAAEDIAAIILETMNEKSNSTQDTAEK